ncbi:MAG: hypothetical protein IT486_02185 [Gammaproteobacteria bacterium]|nr:hypothetical protein [Gammaproteobacteria bacterium]
MAAGGEGCRWRLHSCGSPRAADCPRRLCKGFRAHGAISASANESGEARIRCVRPHTRITRQSARKCPRVAASAGSLRHNRVGFQRSDTHAPTPGTRSAEPRYTYGEIGYINADYDDIDEDGDGLGLGGSFAIHRNVHLVVDYLDGAIRYVDVYDDDTSLVIGGFYDVVPGLALGGEIGFSDDFSAFFLKGRWYFGQR